MLPRVLLKQSKTYTKNLNLNPRKKELAF